jgi:hypothetical protein
MLPDTECLPSGGSTDLAREEFMNVDHTTIDTTMPVLCFASGYAMTEKHVPNLGEDVVEEGRIVHVCMMVEVVVGSP